MLQLMIVQPDPVSGCKPAASVQKTSDKLPSKHGNVTAVVGSVCAPAVVFAEVGAAVIPVEVSLSSARFIVASLAAALRAVKTIDVPVAEAMHKLPTPS